MWENDIAKILVSEEETKEICKKLGEQISKDYENEKILLVGILKGSVVFLADLMRNITCESEIDFMKVSSYCGSKTTGVVNIKKDLDNDISGLNVIIVEDILDSGVTLYNLKKMLEERNPKSIKICTFLDKTANRLAEIDADYVGKVIPDEFVIGYGLDYNEKYRNLPYVAVLDKRVYSGE